MVKHSTTMKKPKLGSGKRFHNLVSEISKKGTARDPEAVAATAGIKKYGPKKFHKLAAAGRRRQRH